MLVFGMDSIYAIGLGLGLRVITDAASNHNVRLGGSLVGLWEGAVLYHFIDKWPKSLDPYVGLGFRLFVDFLFTASVTRLVIVLLWTGLGIVLSDITPAFWYDRGMRRVFRRTSRFIRNMSRSSFKWPFSSVPSRVQFFEIPPTTTATQGSSVTPRSVSTPTPAPVLAPRPRRRSVPGQFPGYTSESSATTNTSVGRPEGASSLPSAMRHTGSNKSSGSSSVSFDLNPRGNIPMTRPAEPTFLVHPPVATMPTPQISGASSLPPSMPIPQFTDTSPLPPSRPVAQFSGASFLPPSMPVPRPVGASSLPPSMPVPQTAPAPSIVVPPFTMPTPETLPISPITPIVPAYAVPPVESLREITEPPTPIPRERTPPPPFSQIDPAPNGTLRRMEKGKYVDRTSVISGGSRNSIIGRADILRDQAIAEEKERDRIGLERKRALLEKRYPDAVRYKVEYEQAHERAMNLHRKAADRYFKANNLEAEEHTIDVHRLKVPEAARQTEIAIRNTLVEGGSRLRVISGRGNHSAGKLPVLKLALMGALEEHHLSCDVDPSNPGVLIVKLPTA